MTEGGPFRKITENVLSYDLKSMEREISKRNKFAVKLSEHIKPGDPIPLFKRIADWTGANPEEIEAYSVATGILKYKKTDEIAEGVTYFHYANPKNPAVELIVSVNKNLNKVSVIKITNIEDAKALQKEETERGGLSIKEMQEIIAAEKKVDFELPDDLKPNIDFEVLNNFFEVGVKNKIKNFKPNDIVFYSKKFGILRFSGKKQEPDDNMKFYWSDGENKVVLEVIYDSTSPEPFQLKSITENGIKTVLWGGYDFQTGQYHYAEFSDEEDESGEKKMIKDYWE